MVTKGKTKDKEQKTEANLQIQAPNLQVAEFKITGTAPLVSNKFSVKAREQMKRTQEAGSTAKKGQKREPKNFQECYEQAMHKADEGWAGIPATSFRGAMISACRLVGFQMTRAKLAVFVEPDGLDAEDRSPLVKITKGEPHYYESYVRLATGVTDLCARPMWDPGWEATVRVKFDADVFTLSDVANLLERAGQQVGVGAGRPDSRSSNGLGFGLFTTANGKGK